MFTGLIQQVGTLISASGNKLHVHAAKSFDSLQHGESVAVNGVCLTLETWDDAGNMSFHTLPETLARTNLGRLSPGAKLNLERALRLGDRLGGHIVTGHVDAVGLMLGIRTLDSGDVELKIELPAAIRLQAAEKGSIAVDGVSLTVIEAGNDYFTCELIPTTLADTALADREPGSQVNLEGDVLAKYVGRWLGGGIGESTLTMDKLREAGFM
ncbi:MAG: riboflavin synthase [Victivallaceae bacterium]|nr:riboflavin synthase [Victivallaceae bacterium]